MTHRYTVVSSSVFSNYSSLSTELWVAPSLSSSNLQHGFKMFIALIYKKTLTLKWRLRKLKTHNVRSDSDITERDKQKWAPQMPLQMWRLSREKMRRTHHPVVMGTEDSLQQDWCWVKSLSFPILWGYQVNTLSFVIIPFSIWQRITYF